MDELALIRTQSGALVDLFNFKATDVRIVDIAHALGLTCRYNGHCRKFYSVAEHSVIVSKRLGLGTSRVRLPILGLLHDTAEAYLGDIVRPLKHGAIMDEYRHLEDRMLDTIHDALGILQPNPHEAALVHEADNWALEREMDYLFTRPNRPTPVDPFEWCGLDPNEACRQFLTRWRRLAEALT